MILKRIFKKSDWGGNWIDLDQKRGKSQAFVEAGKKLESHKVPRISPQDEKILAYQEGLSFM
jgi:hypothetical protein